MKKNYTYNLIKKIRNSGDILNKRIVYCDMMGTVGIEMSHDSILWATPFWDNASNLPVEIQSDGEVGLAWGEDVTWSFNVERDVHTWRRVIGRIIKERTKH